MLGWDVIAVVARYCPCGRGGRVCGVEGWLWECEMDERRTGKGREAHA